MYAIYSRQAKQGATEFHFEEEVSLFGCNAGLIPRMLSKSISQEESEPYKWHIAVRERLIDVGYDGRSIVIDANPRNARDRHVHVCELCDVWGYCHNNWTPILMHMRTLASADSIDVADKKHITLETTHAAEPVYAMLYLRGTVNRGKIDGPWTPPRPSPTNSAFLWPETTAYFLQCMLSRSPELREALGVHEPRR